MKVSRPSRGANEDRRENEDDELVALGTANARCARLPTCRAIRWLQQNGSRRADCCGRCLLPVFAVDEIGHLHARSRNSWMTSRHRQRPLKEFMRSGRTILAVTQPALKVRTVQKAIFESGWWPVRVAVSPIHTSRRLKDRTFGHRGYEFHATIRTCIRLLKSTG